MRDDDSLNDTTPLIYATAIGVGVGLLTLLISWLTLFGPLRTFAGGDPPPTSIELMSAAARELTAAPTLVAAQVPALPAPQWIWSSTQPADDERVTFRRTIQPGRELQSAKMTVSCDNEAEVLVNGDVLGRLGDWQTGGQFDLTDSIRDPPATIEIRARNENGPAGLLAMIDLEYADGTRDRIVTDSTWTIVDDDADSEPAAAVELGPLGIDPWGFPVGFPVTEIDRQIAATPGFAVELVYTVPPQQGSWVSITCDGRGRLIASDQSNGLFRLTPAPLGAPSSQTAVEPIDLPVGAAQGLLCVGPNDLYCVINGNRAEGSGLYRVRDTDGDDQYDAWELLRAMDGGGEHGPHAVILGPDGMLYVVGGNHTAIPEPERSTVPRVWGEDQLLPRMWDSGGHAVGIMAPGGWVCRTDLDGKEWELISIGYRNPYDIAFNVDGELFTYDADMEWDLGAPWYRPTRINHVVSGSDYGWRSGTGKWPAYYPDSLPGILDIGPGSPTGICFGSGADFPRRFQDALFALDWTFGTIWAIHLEADGASYSATKEPFITGRPLPVADIAVNPRDRALYFVVGGRGVPSAVYRVRWIGEDANSGVAASNQSVSLDPEAARLRELRSSLEALHNFESPNSAIDTIWPHLGHDDRFMRHAARIAIEHKSTDLWYSRALAEPDPQTRLTALLALARHDGAPLEQWIFRSLLDLSWDDLTDQQRLEWLRVLSLCIIRGGWPAGELADRIQRRLETVYPTSNDFQNRELCALLVRMDSPVVVARTVPLMERIDAAALTIDEDLLERNDTYGSVILKMASSMPQQQQVHYALALRNATRGWAGDLRDRYFRWFDTAEKTSGGLSFAGFLDGIREEALKHVPEEMRSRYAGAAPSFIPIDNELLPQPEGPGRLWTVDEVVELASSGLTGRDFANGKRMYEAASCLKCHRFAGTGSTIGGPDLTALVTRYSVRDLAEAIVEPSRTVSDQYQFTEFLLDDDTVEIGRVVDQNESSLTIVTNLLTPNLTTTIRLDSIVSRVPSSVSPMMPNLIDRLNADEVLDLLAYLLSEGDSRNRMFGQNRD